MIAQGLGLARQALGLRLGASLIIAGQSSLAIDLLGSGSQLSWDGSNDQGAWVSAGSYELRLETVDRFGVASSYAAGVQVLRLAAAASLAVFNSAGEQIWASALPSSYGGAELRAEASSASSYKLHYGPLSSDVLVWNAVNAQGRRVDAGLYLLRATWSLGQSQGVRSTWIQVMPEAGPGGRAIAIAASDGSFILRLDGAQALEGGVYNLAGECVARLGGNGGSELRWAPGREAALGVYLMSGAWAGPQGQRLRGTAKCALLK